MSEGKTEASIYQQAEDGKTELSLMHFAITNPQWQPPQETTHFISQLKERVHREATGGPSDIHPLSLSESEVKWQASILECRSVQTNTLHHNEPTLFVCPCSCSREVWLQTSWSDLRRWHPFILAETALWPITLQLSSAMGLLPCAPFLLSATAFTWEVVSASLTDLLATIQPWAKSWQALGGNIELSDAWVTLFQCKAKNSRHIILKKFILSSVELMLELWAQAAAHGRANSRVWSYLSMPPLRWASTRYTCMRYLCVAMNTWCQPEQDLYFQKSHRGSSSLFPCNFSLIAAAQATIPWRTFPAHVAQAGERWEQRQRPRRSEEWAPRSLQKFPTLAHFPDHGSQPQRYSYFRLSQCLYRPQQGGGFLTL